MFNRTGRLRIPGRPRLTYAPDFTGTLVTSRRPGALLLSPRAGGQVPAARAIRLDMDGATVDGEGRLFDNLGKGRVRVTGSRNVFGAGAKLDRDSALCD